MPVGCLWVVPKGPHCTRPEQVGLPNRSGGEARTGCYALPTATAQPPRVGGEARRFAPEPNTRAGEQGANLGIRLRRRSLAIPRSGLAFASRLLVATECSRPCTPRATLVWVVPKGPHCTRPEGRSGSNRLTRTKLWQRSGEGGYRPNGEFRATRVVDPHALGSRGFAEAPTPLAHSLGAANSTRLATLKATQPNRAEPATLALTNITTLGRSLTRFARSRPLIDRLKGELAVGRAPGPGSGTYSL